jgi:hypothetical protein
MRTLMSHLTIVAGVMLTLGACADSPTLTDQQRSPDLTAPALAEVQGCVSDGYCILPPISGGGCDPYEEADWSCDDDDCMSSVSYPIDPSIQTCSGGGGRGGDDGDGGGGGGGDGGGGTAPPDCPDFDPDCGNPDAGDGICTADENGTVCEGEDRPECERKPDAPGECVTRFPTTTEWPALGQAVDRMTENTDYCRGAKALAREMYAAGREGGRIVLWNGRNYKPGTNQREMTWGRNDSDYRGRIIEMDSYLAFQVPSLLAHEALHAYLNSINWPGTRDEQETWVAARELECAG